MNALLIPVLEIILSVLIGAVIGLIVSLATKWFKSRHNRLIIIVAGVLLSVGLSQINTINIGWGFDFQLSSLLCAMMVGAIYHNIASGVQVTGEFLDKFTSPIFMLFFIISGSKLNFSIFWSEQALLVVGIALIYIISRVIGKWSGAALSSKITNCSKNVQKYLGFTLVPQAGVALGLASKAEFALSNEIGTLIYTIIIVSTIIYELTGPLITKWALSKAHEINE